MGVRFFSKSIRAVLSFVTRRRIRPAAAKTIKEIKRGMPCPMNLPKPEKGAYIFLPRRYNGTDARLEKTSIFTINRTAGIIRCKTESSLFRFKRAKRTAVFTKLARVRAKAIPFPPIKVRNIKAKKIFTAKQIIPARVGDFESF